MRSRKITWIFFSIFSMISLGIGIYSYTLYSSIEETFLLINEPITRDTSIKRIGKVIFKEKDPISILLMGIDERENDSGRSDSLILLSVNPNTKSLKMISIPRDTRTEIIDIGKGYEDKINHAYAFGGIEMTVSTVEHFLNVPIDYFVKIIMESFQEIVNTIGGVTVINPFAFQNDGVYFAEGEIHLNGEEALSYTRMRYEDPRGDFGRQERQKDVIKAIIDKGANYTSINQFTSILEVLKNHVRTNLSSDEILKIKKYYKDARYNIESIKVDGTGVMLNKIYYYVVSEEERIMLSTKLKEHLEIESPKTSDTN